MRFLATAMTCWTIGGMIGVAAAQPPQPKPRFPTPDATLEEIENRFDPTEGEERKPALFKRKPLPADPRDDELQKLLKARFNTALREMESLWKLHQIGSVPMELVCDAAIKRLLPAGIEAISSPAERIVLGEQYVEVAKIIEGIAKAKYQQGREPLQGWLQATYLRQDAEIQLLKLKRAAKEPAKR